MKNLISSLILTFMLLVIIPSLAEANKSKAILETMNTEVTAETSTKSSTELSPEVEKLLNRLDEIKEMDIASMNAKEKKELRKEVRSISKNLKSYSVSNADAKAVAERGSSHGIYISTGAAIIIVLLLILLF